MKNLSRVLVTLLFLLSASFARAANPFDVIINEIAWMGTEVSYNDEWIELYNQTDFQINLAGWKIVSQDGTPEINLAGIILTKGFYLLERTDDNTVSNVSADQVYTGALGNNGENLNLYDNSGNVIDSVNCSSGWCAGDNQTKQTMERINPLMPGDNPANWQTSQNPGGTPKAKNSVATGESIAGAEPQVELQPEPPAQEKPQLAEEPQSESKEALTPRIYPSNIIINEILPSPEGPDEEEEWVEIFNHNDFEVDLSEWQITDTTGSTKAYIFPKGTRIGPQGFLVLSRPTTKITLNNDGDGLKFLQPDGKIADEVSYEKAPRGQSYNRIDSKWTWSPTLTPGTANIIPLSISETKEEKLETKPSTVERLSDKEKLAAIGEQLPKKKSFFLILIALVTAIFSGVIILILKRKIKQGRSI